MRFSPCRQASKRQRTETDGQSEEPASPLPRGRSGKLNLKEVLALLNADTGDAQAQGSCSPFLSLALFLVPPSLAKARAHRRSVQVCEHLRVTGATCTR
jgi:hypothetical protein